MSTNFGIPAGIPQAVSQAVPSSAGNATQIQSGVLDAVTKDILQQVVRPRSSLAPAVPGVNPSELQHKPMMSGPTPPGYGVQAFLYNLGASVHNAVAEHKETQVRKAMADYSAIGNAWERAQTIAGGDPNKAEQLFQKDPITQAILGDPKKMKHIAKALSMDWLNPEKTTVYGEALKRTMQADQAGKMMKVLRALHLAHQPQPQLNPQQRQQFIQQEAKKLPMLEQGASPQEMASVLNWQVNMEKAKAEADKASAALRDKYQISPDKDGNLVAVNKSDPHDAFKVTDAQGKPLTSVPKQKPEILQPRGGGPPYGILRDGKVVLPTSADWTGQDQALFEAAKASYASGQAALEHRLQISSAARAQMWGRIRSYGVIDRDSGQLVQATADEIADHPGKYAPASGAARAMSANALFGEIDYTSNQVDKAIADLPATGFDAKSRAQIAAVLRSTDPESAWSSFLTSSVAGTLTDPQIKYVTGIVSLAESAMSLRSVAGMGQGSDTLRNAIWKMLPGPNTPSKVYAQRQMELFRGEVNALRKSIPGLGKLTPNTAAPPTKTPQLPPPSGGRTFEEIMKQAGVK